MRKPVILIILISIQALSLFSQSENLIISEELFNSTSNISTIYNNIDRLEREKYFELALSKLAETKKLAVRTRPVAINGRFSVFANYYIIRIPGNKSGLLSLQIDLPSLDHQENPYFLAFDLVRLTIEHFSQTIDKPDIEILISGGQFPETYPWGTEAWLHDAAGYYPDYLLHLSFSKDISQAIAQCIPNGRGFSARAIQNIARVLSNTFPQGIDTNTMLINQLGIRTNANHSIYTAQEIPVILCQVPDTITKSSFRNLANSTIDALDILATDSSEGERFLIIPRNPPLVIDEIWVLALSIILFLAYLVWIYGIRDRLWLGFNQIIKKTWRFLFIFAINAIFCLLAWLLTSGLGLLGFHPAILFNNPGFGIGLIAFFGLSIFAISYSTKISLVFPNQALAYACVAHFIAISLYLFLLVLDIRLSLLGIAIMFLTLPPKNQEKKILLSLRIIIHLALFISIVFIINNVTEGQAFLSNIRDTWWQSTAIIAALNAIPINMALAMIVTRRSGTKVRSYKIVLIRCLIGLGLGILIAYICSVWLLDPVPVDAELIYRDSGTTATLDLSLSKPVENGSLQYQDLTLVNNLNALHYSFPVKQLDSAINVSFTSRVFLKRNLITIHVENAASNAEEMILRLHSSSTLNLIAADKPFQYSDKETVLIPLGPYPPQNFTVNIELPLYSLVNLEVLWTIKNDPRLSVDLDSVLPKIHRAYFERDFGVIQ